MLDALNMAAWTRRGESIDGVVCHSDAGVAIHPALESHRRRLRRSPDDLGLLCGWQAGKTMVGQSSVWSRAPGVPHIAQDPISRVAQVRDT
ncbi:MAG TPA: hypothetical protein VNA20_10415 [Frankiaceae bacterium]|nr:hypothetical protein [Frankiaceae bacterium]